MDIFSLGQIYVAMSVPYENDLLQAETLFSIKHAVKNDKYDELVFPQGISEDDVNLSMLLNFSNAVLVSGVTMQSNDQPGSVETTFLRRNFTNVLNIF